MSIIKSEDEKKWINAFLVLCSILLGFVTIRFMEQMGEWFDLEAKVTYYIALTQGAGFAAGALGFLIALKNKFTQSYLNEVYHELTKVVWSDKDTAIKLTIGIVISLSIVSVIFVLVDYIFQQTLALIY